MTEEEKQQFLNPPRVDISTIKIFDAGDCVMLIYCKRRCIRSMRAPLCLFVMQ